MKLSLLFGALVAMLFAANPVQAGTFVQFRTQFGDIHVELYDQDKPITVKNFLRYVENGNYNNMFAHRAVNNFVIQAGALYAASRGDNTNILSNIFYLPTFPAIPNENLNGKFYSNTYGTIAMAMNSNPNSATGSFFFNVANNSFLDANTPQNSGGFTVFGRVVGGTNVLNKLILGGSSSGIKSVNYGYTVLAETPIPSDSPSMPFNANKLIYMDVSVLNVGVTKVGNSAQITWTSVNAKTNFVEYTTVMPPLWQPLSHVIGNGGGTTVTDNAVGNGNRFYRVRVAY